ncbi:HD domain-containing protein [Furfurilactobacillus siliginis]|uniref:Hydrolase n=1 Tax=Furfurilactobacillus siliginis TaxID=348151 RepID=A0A0R2LCU6_9LACO|nr:HD domain-containing protein [Furfurilactobacillus siliginis]KRN96471.1 hydrolase [Furfurilactobacillus siliginis]GEK29432.1 phosphohydrolase [Furfurilactobacillus siliginis]
MAQALTSDEQQQLQAIIAYAQHVLGQERSGHDFFHVDRVAKLAAQIDRTEATGQLFLILAAAYLHDVTDEKVVPDPQTAHVDLQQQLQTWGVNDETIAELFAIIDHMSFSKNLTEHQLLSSAGQIVQDADRMDAIGAIGIARTLTYGGNHDRVLYDPEIEPRTGMTKAMYRSNEGTTINHFYEKLLLIKNQLNTPAAKALAEHRQQVMINFLTEFKQEWDGQA